MITTRATNKLARLGRFALPAALLVLSLSCGDDSTSPVSGDRVIDSFPLELGNSWEYALEQSVYVPRQDTTQPPISLSSTGRQLVSITRTENIGGLESFGMKTTHMIDYLFSEGSDTVIERRYFAPAGDGRVLLRAEQAIFNPGGGFIPFANGGDSNKPRYGTLIEVDGQQKFISLETLGYLLSDTRGSFFRGQAPGSSLLASDGLENDDNTILYRNDYVYVHNELYKGLKWVSLAAEGVGGIDISNSVTNILSELDGRQGPIAEVEQTNSLIGALASEQYRQRFYYKGGVGLIRAEISDPGFIIIAQYPDSSSYIGIGTWSFVKTLTSYNVR